MDMHVDRARKMQKNARADNNLPFFPISSCEGRLNILAAFLRIRQVASRLDHQEA